MATIYKFVGVTDYRVIDFCELGKEMFDESSCTGMHVESTPTGPTQDSQLFDAQDLSNTAPLHLNLADTAEF